MDVGCVCVCVCSHSISSFHIFCSVDFYIFGSFSTRSFVRCVCVCCCCWYFGERLCVVIRIAWYAYNKFLIIYGRFSTCKSWQITTFNMHINNLVCLEEPTRLLFYFSLQNLERIFVHHLNWMVGCDYIVLCSVSVLSWLPSVLLLLSKRMQRIVIRHIQWFSFGQLLYGRHCRLSFITQTQQQKALLRIPYAKFREKRTAQICVKFSVALRPKPKRFHLSYDDFFFLSSFVTFSSAKIKAKKFEEFVTFVM